MRFTINTGITVLTLLCAGLAVADDNRGQHDKPRRPPQAAVDACAALTEGDPCTFTGRRDSEVAGTCFAPAEKALACRPDSPPPGLYREKPEQADVEPGD